MNWVVERKWRHEREWSAIEVKYKTPMQPTTLEECLTHWGTYLQSGADEMRNVMSYRIYNIESGEILPAELL